VENGLCLCPFSVDIKFYFIILIYNVYILHHLAHDHISYLHYTSLNWGLKTWMLHSPPPTICTVHNTILVYMYKIYIIILMLLQVHNSRSNSNHQSFVSCNLHNPRKCIPSSASESLSCTTSFPRLQQRLVRKSPRCGSRNSICQNGSLHTYRQMYI
jgi:hypothetical protein